MWNGIDKKKKKLIVVHCWLCGSEFGVCVNFISKMHYSKKLLGVWCVILFCYCCFWFGSFICNLSWAKR